MSNPYFDDVRHTLEAGWHPELLREDPKTLGDRVKRAVKDVGEFGLIARIASILGDGGAIVGIGDDAAVVEIGHERYLLATVDMLVEEVHFRPDWITGFELGERALAVNLSDIAAMGGGPPFALASIAISPDTPLRLVEDIFRCLRPQANPSGAGVEGGHTARTRGPLTPAIPPGLRAVR